MGDKIDNFQNAISSTRKNIIEISNMTPEVIVEESKKRNVIVSSSPILKPEVFPDTSEGREMAKSMYLGKNKTTSKESKKQEEERIKEIVDRADMTDALSSMIEDIFEEL